MLDLNEITEVCQALNDRLGPQEWTMEGPVCGLYSVFDCDGNRVHEGVREEARFIARAHTWLPVLVEELTQAREELAAVDESLGNFYAPVLDENDEPCGSFWKDRGVWVMRDALELAQVRIIELRGHNRRTMDVLHRDEAEIEYLRQALANESKRRRTEVNEALNASLRTEEASATIDYLQVRTAALGTQAVDDD